MLFSYTIDCCSYSEGELIRDLTEAREMIEVGEPVHLYLANCCYDLGAFYYSEDNYDEAKPLILEALDIYEKLGNDEEVVNSLNALGAIYMFEENHQQAEEAFLSAFKICDRIYKEPDIDAAVNLKNLGLFYGSQKNYKKCKKWYKKALKVYQKLPDGDHSEAIEEIEQSLEMLKTC